MSRTGAQIFVDYSEFLDDYVAATTTSAGNAGGTTLVCTTLSRFGDRRLEGWWIRITNAGSNQYQERRITAFTSSTGTVTVSPAFSAQVGSSVTFELHRYEPQMKFRSLDEARLICFGDVFQVVADETITTDGWSQEYALPSSLTRTPIQVYEEIPEAAGYQWNLLTSPYMDSLTGWTASAGTASLVTQGQLDRLVPKYDTQCTRWVVAASATYGQDLSSDYAATAAGRRVTFDMWVYSRVSGAYLRITDDGGPNNGTAHQGLGWEKLSVTADIDADNATTLTVYLVSPDSTARNMFMNRAWFYYGDEIKTRYGPEALRDVRIDSENKRLVFRDRPQGRRQLQLVGRAPLSALGTVAASQVTNTMEVDAQTQRILFHDAAIWMFNRLGLKTSSVDRLAQNIQLVAQERPNTRMNWSVAVPVPRIESPYA